MGEDGGGNEEPSKLREKKAGRIAHPGVFIFVIAIHLTKVQLDVVLRKNATIIFDILDILAQAEVNIQLQRSNDGCTAHGACDHK